VSYGERDQSSHARGVIERKGEKAGRRASTREVPHEPPVRSEMDRRKVIRWHEKKASPGKKKTQWKRRSEGRRPLRRSSKRRRTTESRIKRGGKNVHCRTFPVASEEFVSVDHHQSKTGGPDIPGGGTRKITILPRCRELEGGEELFKGKKPARHNTETDE